MSSLTLIIYTTETLLGSSGSTLSQRAERRFSGVERLYGAEGLERLRAAHVAVVGLGGVGLLPPHG